MVETIYRFISTEWLRKICQQNSNHTRTINWTHIRVNGVKSNGVQLRCGLETAIFSFTDVQHVARITAVYAEVIFFLEENENIGFPLWLII